jgi:hypothetical protein
MKRTTMFAAALAVSVFASSAAFAETTVKLTDMHICCGGCTKAIMKVAEGLTAVKVTVDQDAEECTIVAADASAAQKAVDAIAAAGFHAKVTGDGVSMKSADAPAGKVQRLTVSNAHNCCGACTKAIQAVLKTVDGVQADTCKPRETEFVVEGNFDAKAVVAGLEKAGFHVTAK